MANGAGPDQNIGGDLGMPAENGFQGNNMMGGEAAPRNTPAGPRPGGGGRNRMDSEFVEGKLFLGGLDNATTKETLLAYVRQWCVDLLERAASQIKNPRTESRPRLPWMPAGVKSTTMCSCQAEALASSHTQTQQQPRPFLRYARLLWFRNISNIAKFGCRVQVRRLLVRSSTCKQAWRMHWNVTFQIGVQHREHVIDGKKVEAKAAVPKNSSSGSSLTKKMFVGGTVRTLKSHPSLSQH